MNDFSIQGLAASKYCEACALLRHRGYTLLDKKICADIINNRIEEMRTIDALLTENGLQAKMTDITDTLSQA